MLNDVKIGNARIAGNVLALVSDLAIPFVNAVAKLIRDGEPINSQRHPTAPPIFF